MIEAMSKHKKMKTTPIVNFLSKITQWLKSLDTTLRCFYHSSRALVFSFVRLLLFHANPFWLQLCYFVTLFMLGYFVLTVLEPRKPGFRVENYDLLFTAVSAVTVSSMATVEMEVFSNTQLVFLAILMLMGGEVFTSMLELQLKRFKLLEKNQNQKRVDSASSDSPPKADLENGIKSLESSDDLNYKSMKFLGIIVLSYFITLHLCGFVLVCLYLGLVPTAREVLRSKNLNIQMFSFFTTISTFTNCGFLPTNESMMVFKKNSGLLVILIPLVLLGNTLYPVFLRLVLLILHKMSNREELEYVLRYYFELGYRHLLSGIHCWYLALTAIAFIVIQFALFLTMESNSQATSGLTSFEKVIGSLFQVVNSRHAGESVFDLSLVSPAIVVLFITMMYLPSYTIFLPREDQNFPRTHNNKGNDGQRRISSVEFLILSPLSFLVVVIMLICITESENMQKDPLNFSVLNILFEVISAYGNVGLSLGYSCEKRHEGHGNCKDAWYGFAGRWSDISKLILILVMVFGRLRKFHNMVGKAWKLL